MTSIKMPSECVICDAAEMEYDGSGFDWQKFGEITGIVVGSLVAIGTVVATFKCGFNPSNASVAPNALNNKGVGLFGGTFVSLIGTGISAVCLYNHNKGEL